MAEEEEYVQLSISEVFVYKIPPKSSAAGHKCVVGELVEQVQRVRASGSSAQLVRCVFPLQGL
jgi:hypothetical protein